MHLIQQKILEPQHTLEQLSRMISESMFTFKWLAILLFECFYPILVTLSWIFEDLSSYVLIESITGGIPAYQVPNIETLQRFVM